MHPAVNREEGVSRWTGAQHCVSSLPGNGTDVSKIQHDEPVAPTHSSDQGKTGR